MKIAVTGGIGSGKSYVCSLLRKKGIAVFDCDSEAKKIMRNSEKVRTRLVAALGAEAYIGTLPNKPFIARFILESESNAAIVNGIIHPAVADEFRASGLDFMECAILFTSGFDALVNKIVCVAAPLDVRVRRIMQRDGITKEAARKWIGCQMSQEEMTRRSDYVIDNGVGDNLDRQIDSMLEALQCQ